MYIYMYIYIYSIYKVIIAGQEICPIIATVRVQRWQVLEKQAAKNRKGHETSGDGDLWLLIQDFSARLGWQGELHGDLEKKHIVKFDEIRKYYHDTIWIDLKIISVNLDARLTTNNLHSENFHTLLLAESVKLLDFGPNHQLNQVLTACFCLAGVSQVRSNSRPVESMWLWENRGQKCILTIPIS